MKSIFVGLLFLSIGLSAQKTDSIPYLRVEDPTQLFNTIGINTGVTAGIIKDNLYGYRKGNIYDAFWAFNINGTIAFKKMRFSMQLPITNNGNPATALGDLQLESGYQIHNGNSKYKSTLISFGVRFPSGMVDERSDLSTFYRNGYFNFYANYTGSVTLSKKWHLYPVATFYLKHSPPQTSYSIGGPCTNPPDVSEPGFQIGTSGSYRFGSKSFILLHLIYENGTRSYRDNCGNTQFNTTETSENLYLSARYQFAFNNSSQMYFLLSGSFLNLKGEPALMQAYPLNQFGFFIGYQYYLAH
jgi:hypothetical protein